MPKGSLKPYAAPYKGHVQFRSDKTTSEHGTSTSVGRSKVTEGRKPMLPAGKKSRNRSVASRKVEYGK